MTGVSLVCDSIVNIHWCFETACKSFAIGVLVLLAHGMARGDASERGERSDKIGRGVSRCRGERRGRGSLPRRPIRVRGASPVARLLQKQTVAASQPLSGPKRDDRLHSINFF
jgi:hypothetical protein